MGRLHRPGQRGHPAAAALAAHSAQCGNGSRWRGSSRAGRRRGSARGAWCWGARGPRGLARDARCGGFGRAAAAQLLLPPSRSPRRGSSSLLPAPPGASPPPSATLRRPLALALPARVARASSGKLPSRRLPPASARRSPPQAPLVASAEAEAYTEPELVLLEALLGVQARDS